MRFIENICLLLIVVSSGLACKNDSKTEYGKPETSDVARSTVKSNSSTENLNISVILDLSDRISPEKYPSPAMEFYLRDVGYLKSLASSFETHLLNKKVILIDDKIQVFIDPEPSDQSINQKIEELKVHFTKQNVTKKAIFSLPKKYSVISQAIYESAIEDNNYVGSDIWGFFKNKVDDYCLDIGYRNILVILTDGYLYHRDAKFVEANRSSYLIPQNIRSNHLTSSNWEQMMDEKDYGFIVANKDLSNLEVLVLGINPAKGNPYEGDVIRSYWSKWLDEMGVKNYQIKQADLPTHMDKIIQDFILE